MMNLNLSLNPKNFIMEKLITLVTELEKNVAFKDNLNLKVSQATVSWQIDHCLKVINSVCEALKSSNPEEYKWKFNHIRTLIFFKGSIPRGKVKAPKTVQSYDTITLENLNDQIVITKILLQEIKQLPAKSNFTHPFFGVLNLKQTVKFLNLHTNHHVKIIKDIISN